MKRVFSQRGGSMVEFALILPILLIIIFAIIEFGIIMYNKAIVTNASREGARAGIVFRLDAGGVYSAFDQTEITAVVNDYLKTTEREHRLINFPYQISDIEIPTPVWNPTYPTTAPADTTLTVTVRFKYHWFILPVPVFVPQLAGFNPLILEATTIMKME